MRLEYGTITMEVNGRWALGAKVTVSVVMVQTSECIKHHKIATKTLYYV